MANKFQASVHGDGRLNNNGGATIASSSSSEIITSLKIQFMGNKIVTVEVGPNKTQFAIHKNLLVTRSSYFRACLEGGFKESATGTVYLEESDPDVFSFVAEFLYTGTIDHKNLANHGKHAKTFMLINLWKLADYLDVLPLPNIAIGLLRQIHNVEDRGPPRSGPDRAYELVRMTALEREERLLQSIQEVDLLPFVRPCYDNTLPGSPLRKWISDLFVTTNHKIGEKPEDSVRSECCEDFLFDVFWGHSKSDPKLEPQSYSINRSEENDDVDAFIASCLAERSPPPKPQPRSNTSIGLTIEKRQEEIREKRERIAELRAIRILHGRLHNSIP